MNYSFIELEVVLGGGTTKKAVFNVAHIVNFESGPYGAIIHLSTKESYAVKQTYDEVAKILNKTSQYIG